MSDQYDQRAPTKRDPIGRRILIAVLLIAAVVVAASFLRHKQHKPIALPPVIVAEVPVVKDDAKAPVVLPDTSDLRPSVDVPAIQEPSHEDAQPAPSTDAGREAELPAVEVPAVTAGDDDRHARRRPYHVRHGRAYHRASSGSCEPVCDFFKATARAAGLIQ